MYQQLYRDQGNSEAGSVSQDNSVSGISEQDAIGLIREQSRRGPSSLTYSMEFAIPKNVNDPCELGEAFKAQTSSLLAESLHAFEKVIQSQPEKLKDLKVEDISFNFEAALRELTKNLLIHDLLDYSSDGWRGAVKAEEIPVDKLEEARQRSGKIEIQIGPDDVTLTYTYARDYPSFDEDWKKATTGGADLTTLSGRGLCMVSMFFRAAYQIELNLLPDDQGGDLVFQSSFADLMNLPLTHSNLEPVSEEE